MSSADLFAQNERGGLAEPERFDLGADTWIEYAPSWLPGDEALKRDLIERMAWREERREMYDRVVRVPRLGATIDDRAQCPEALREPRRFLEARYGRTFQVMHMAWYRNGGDGVAPHGDRIGREREETVIAIISLGDARVFRMRENDGPGRREMALGHGDLLVMGGRCQRTWTHEIPKVRHAGERVSVQLREAHSTIKVPGQRWTRRVAAP